VIVFDDPHDYALLDPDRAYDIQAWVPDPEGFAQRTGFDFSECDEPGAVAELTFIRAGAVPSQYACEWWRDQIRGSLGDDYFDEDFYEQLPWAEEHLVDGYAESLAWTAEQLLTATECDILGEWLRKEFGHSLLVEQRRWVTLPGEDWWVRRHGGPQDWTLANAPTYELPFEVVARPTWLLLG
jgi:hypothetical protein